MKMNRPLFARFLTFSFNFFTFCRRTWFSVSALVFTVGLVEDTISHVVCSLHIERVIINIINFAGRCLVRVAVDRQVVRAELLVQHVHAPS